MNVGVDTSDKFHPSDNMESLTFLADKVDQIYDTPLTNELVKAVLNVVGELREAYTLIGTEWAEGMERGASLDEALPTAEIAGASPASIPTDGCDAGYACDPDGPNQWYGREFCPHPDGPCIDGCSFCGAKLEVNEHNHTLQQRNPDKYECVCFNC